MLRIFMKKYTLYLGFILFLFSFWSCSNKIIFERKAYTSYYPSKLASDYNSANIQMEVVEAKNADSINKIIFENIKEISSFIDNNNFTIRNYNDLTTSFITSYKDVKKQVPNDKLKSWEYHLETNVEYETEDFVNIVINYYSSYGESNGIADKRSLVFDKISGKQLHVESIFSSVSKVSQLVELKFRAKYGVNPSLSYNSQGFCFPINRFKLANTLLFSIEGITFYYNLNEIAPFEKGHYEVFMSYDELDNYLLIK